MMRMLGLSALCLGAAVFLGCGNNPNTQPVFVNPDDMPPLSASESDEIKSWDEQVADEERALLVHLDGDDWINDPELVEKLRAIIEPLAAHYFLKAKNPRGKPVDPVARFHLGNGARLEQINWLGDVSSKGLRESAGVMVNYLYRLDDIEKNHEAYANDDEVVASNAVKKLLKGEGRRLLDLRLS